MVCLSNVCLMSSVPLNVFISIRINNRIWNTHKVDEVVFDQHVGYVYLSHKYLEFPPWISRRSLSQSPWLVGDHSHDNM